MLSRSSNPIDEIEAAALDEDVSLANALRKVIALGGRVGSTELREWASLELKGYVGSSADLPEYRKVRGAIMLDGRNMVALIRNQQISSFDLPEGVREHITEEVTLGHGVGELESMLAQARAEGGVRLALPGSAELVKIMNHHGERAGLDFQTIERVYWSVSLPTLEGVLDAIRNDAGLARGRDARRDTSGQPALRGDCQPGRERRRAWHRIARPCQSRSDERQRCSPRASAAGRGPRHVVEDRCRARGSRHDRRYVRRARCLAGLVGLIVRALRLNPRRCSHFVPTWA